MSVFIGHVSGMGRDAGAFVLPLPPYIAGVPVCGMPLAVNQSAIGGICK